MKQLYPRLAQVLSNRDGGYRCAYCGCELIPPGASIAQTSIILRRKGRQGSIDHVVPKSEGGDDKLSNLVLACIPCNNAKGSKPPHEFLLESIGVDMQSKRSL